MPGGRRRIDFCIDHFASMGYDARDVRAVVAHLLEVYGGPSAWKFLEEGDYQVVQDRLLEMEVEEKQMQHQQLECHQQQVQQDSLQVEDEPPQQVVQDRLLEIGDDEKLKQDQHLQPHCHQQQDGQQVEDEREPPQVPDFVLPHAPALTTWGEDVSSSATQPPSSDNIEHDITQPTTQRDVAQGTGAEHGP